MSKSLFKTLYGQKRDLPSHNEEIQESGIFCISKGIISFCLFYRFVIKREVRPNQPKKSSPTL